MPSGGRRPGAGAPKGNTNALRSGNHSPRTLEVYLACRRVASGDRVLIARNDEPRLSLESPPETAPSSSQSRLWRQAAFDANIFRSVREIGPRHVPAVVRLSQSRLRRLAPAALPRPAPPTATKSRPRPSTIASTPGPLSALTATATELTD